MYVHGSYLKINHWQRKNTLLCIGIFAIFTFFPSLTFAQVKTEMTSPMAMTLTPPYFSIVLGAGTTWSSLLKFSNGSLYPLTVRADAQNFRTNGGSGIEFFSRSNELTTQPYELAAWVTLPQGEILVPAGSTVQIPFTIKVPQDAEPGGHYAGIMIGSEVGDAAQGGVGVSSALSSLLLVRVAGETIESGFIYDFSPAQFITQSQDASFQLEFKNTGNVHIEPKGEIEITNMFGKIRGRIALQSGNSFGHILPFSTKNFMFTWNGETNYLDIGLYRARAALHYGEEGEKVAYHSTYFLVFPWMPAIGILSFLYVFTRFVRVGVRRYVKQALRVERERLAHYAHLHSKTEGNDALASHKNPPPTLSLKILERPLKIGVQDFLSVGGVARKHVNADGRKKGMKVTYVKLFHTYRLFFVYIIVLIIGFSAIGYYFYQVFTAEREYQVSVMRGVGNQVVPEKPDMSG